ncbi:MAG: hypothetical protein MZW92_75750, partial [Comamonadaceae bacterium]|nr:hypothetical protein [Comamonadaceae bacterium]
MPPPAVDPMAWLLRSLFMIGSSLLFALAIRRGEIQSLPHEPQRRFEHHFLAGHGEPPADLRGDGDVVVVLVLEEVLKKVVGVFVLTLAIRS